MRRTYSYKKPDKFEAVGNGNYLYHWDIQKETVERLVPYGTTSKPFVLEKSTTYSCNEAVIQGKPDYDKCVEAVIRASYTSDEELALINKYNSYLMKIHDDESIVGEYAKFLSYVSSVKEIVKNDISEMV